MTETSTETAEAIDYARGILNRTPDAALAGIIGRYDRLLAENEPGIFSWHQALYDVAQEAKRAAEELAATHYQDATGWHRKHDVYGGPHDEPRDRAFLIADEDVSFPEGQS